MQYFAQISGFLNNFPFLTAILAAFFLLYWTNAFFVVYHLTRFGIGPVPKLFALVFLLGSLLLFSMTTLAYGRVDVGQLVQGVKDGFHLQGGVPDIKFPKFTFPSGSPTPNQ